MRRILPAALALLFLSIPRPADAQIIRTIAGGMPDDLPALSSNIYQPAGAVVDAAGNLYIASRLQERIFKVDPQGHLTVFAGSGIRGVGPDIVPAREAAFLGLRDLAIDGAGNIYAMATGGTNDQGFGGYVRIDRIDPTTGTLTKVLEMGFRIFESSTIGSQPGGMALDPAGNIYFAQADPGRIFKWDAAAHTVTLLAGGGSQVGDGFLGPETRVCKPLDVAIDPAGFVYYADQCSTSLVRSIGPGGGRVFTEAGGGSLLTDDVPATSALLAGASAITFDATGSLIISDSSHHRVRRVDGSTFMISTIAGLGSAGFSGDGGPALGAQLNLPAAIAFDASGSMYIADRWNNRIRRVDGASQVMTTVAGNGDGAISGDGGPALTASLYGTSDIVGDRRGNLIVSDGGGEEMRIIEHATGRIRSLGGPAWAGQIALDAQGNVFAVEPSLDVNYASNTVRRLDAATGQVTVVAGGGSDYLDGVPATEMFLHVPAGVAVDSKGNLFISQYWFNMIRRVDAETGIITTVSGDGTFGLAGDGGPARLAILHGPTRLAIDAADNLYFRDNLNGRIRRIDAATGIISTVAGGGTDPADGIPATDAGIFAFGNITADLDGTLYLVEGPRIRRVDASTGIITTVAGNGSYGSTGDGGPALDAAIFPSGVTINAFGSLVMAESWTGRIRHVSQCANPDVTPPTLSIAVSPKVLRQTNHKMVPITVSAMASDDCSRPLMKLVSITSNEPDDAPGNGDGKTIDDIQGAEVGIDDFEFLLRAERLKAGGGRVYTITYSAEDEAGHVTLARVNVLVSRESKLVTAPAR